MANQNLPPINLVNTEADESTKIQKEKQSNAKRFIKAYNKLDQSLRVQYNLKRGQTFSDVIRRSSSLNSIVRKFQDLLIDYGRLRNAIIHRNNDEYIIAEPHTKVVEQFEKICDLVCTPPLAINSVCRKVLLSVQSNVKLKQVIGLIASSGYSNLPIYKDHSLIGLANGQRLLDVIGDRINKDVDINEFLENTPIEDVIKVNIQDNYFAVVDISLTIEQALNMFYSNRKLLAILITKTGNFMETALGIITAGDIIDLNSVLDDFE